MEKKKLAKLGFIYAGVSVLAQAMNILLVPVFTRNLTAEQFGQYNIITSLQSVLSILITLGIFSGLSRFINEFEDKNKLKNAALSVSFVWGILMLIAGALLNPYIAGIVFGNDPDRGAYFNYTILSAFLLCMITIYTTYYSMQYKAIQFSIVNIGKVILVLLITTYLLVFKQKDIIGALQAQLISYGIVLLGLVLYDIRNLRFTLSGDELKAMLKYGTGLMPGQASAWIYTLIDRYFIKELIGLRAVAIYSMGYKIGMLMDPIFISPFKSVFTAYKYSIYKNCDSKEKIREIFVYYNFIGWFCILGFSLFAKNMIEILSTSEYIEAYRVVPIIVFSYFVYGLGEFFGLGLHISNKSLLCSAVSAVGAFSNIILNLLLIPVAGMYGAALATVICYLIMNVIYCYLGKRYLD